MVKLKTSPNESSVVDFLESVAHEKKKQDSYQILEMMQKITGEKPIMWGGSIIGFGSYHFKYASGREGDWFLTGFSPRKQNLTLYIMSGFAEYDELLSRLGKYKTGKSCLYVNKIEDVDTQVLMQLVKLSVDHVSATNG
jgi:hypothetical protein